MHDEYILPPKSLHPFNNTSDDTFSKMLEIKNPRNRSLTSQSSTTVDGFSNFLATAIEKAILKNLLLPEDIKSYDPVVIVTLPRLALLIAMIDCDWRNMLWQHDERWIRTKREEEEAFASGKHWFRHREIQLQQLASQCQSIQDNVRTDLEQSLIRGQGGEIFKHICSLSDALISSRNFCKLLQSTIDDWKTKQTEEELDSLII
ncbi:hypothetical protein INT43_006442 [Umbelopsis isabellina]|uniref:Uncharacterized protein n=1 Tax=Mortierella isabellina TaxID=91625 RepID=A0A8H7Q2E6_MORIS|nr:hypothetical protein INT43_006442 [Umbelopsis isabellina]